MSERVFHVNKLTLRLNDETEDFLESESRRRDVPKAVIARDLIVEQMRQINHDRRVQFRLKGEVQGNRVITYAEHQRTA